MTVDELSRLLPSLVPFVGRLGITYEHLDAAGARLTLGSDASLLNHVGTAHAGVLFTLAESASGAVIVVATSEVLDRVTPVVGSADITFHRAAVGDLVATAAPAGDLADAVEAATAGRRAEVEVRAEVRDGRDHPCATAVVHWVLRPASTA